MNFQYPFLDPGLSLKKRIHDLISRLTVEEKAGFIPTRNQAVENLFPRRRPVWAYAETVTEKYAASAICIRCFTEKQAFGGLK